MVFSETEGKDGSFCLEVAVYAKPGSKVEKVKVGESGEFVIQLKDRAIEGAANKGITKILGKVLGVAKSHVLISKGASSKLKRVQIYFYLTDRKDLSYYKDKLSETI